MLKTSFWRDDSYANRRMGVVLLSLSVLSFSTLDSSVKWLIQLQTLPLLELIWLRFLSQAIVSGVIFAPHYKMELLKINKIKLQVVRAIMLGTMTSINFWSLQYLQLTETASILFSSPLIVAVISHWWLKQPLRLGQWAAIMIGFIGVLIVVRPTSNVIHPAIFLMLVNAVIFAVFTLLTRHLAQHENPAAMQWYSSLGPVIIFAPWVLPDFVMPSHLIEWLLVLATGVSGGVGHYLWAPAHQYASSATLAPFGYQQLIYMAFWGWLLFGDIPPLAVFVGGSVIVASGLYLLWEQRKTPLT